MSKFREGDLVKIPFPDGRAILAKVLYIGCRFKNVIGIGVCQWIPAGATLQNMDVEAIKGTPLYTNIVAAQHHGWTVLGNRGLSEEEEKATLRTVGQDDVYLKDDLLRKATKQDREQLHEMLGIGMPNVYDWSEKILAGLPIRIPSNPEQTPKQEQ